MLIGAAIGAGIAAATGGDPIKGALGGAIGGLTFQVGFGVFGDLGLNGIGQLMAAGAVSGVASSAVTGGDIGMGALTGAIGGAVMYGMGFSAGDNGQLAFGGENGFTVVSDFIKSTVSDQYMQQLIATAGAGALGGGVASELNGGSFGEGAAWGAGSAAAGYVASKAIQQYLNEQEIAKQAEEGAKGLAEKAINYVVKSFWDKSANDLFKKWFGTNDFLSKFRVISKLYMTRVGFDKHVSYIHKNEPGAYAYVVSDNKLEMFLCDAFYQASADLRASIVLHEGLHKFAKANIVPSCYGQEYYRSDAWILARISPIHAQHNADNYRMFAVEVSQK